ncbi:DUF3551 domain-containing protein [Bradyrhizobium sp. STM 3557]|uniref:DUF3551 domain-containing protein n=1 Tax=Bradyrhizobium sp. STM 3557 TaxID=578920 RepID=UPI00388E07CE
MWNCSYADMAQCNAAASGRGGYCRRDPFLLQSRHEKGARADAQMRSVLAVR